MTDRREIIMRYEREKGLVPVNPWEWEALDNQYPKDKDLWVTIRRKRSVIHSNLYWARLQKVIDSGVTKFFSVTALHKAIKFDLGYVKALRKLNGDITYETDSTAFDRMDQTEFNAYFAEAMRLIAEYYHINPEDLDA